VEEAVGIATSAGVMEGHDVPPDVLTSVAHWLRMGGLDIVSSLDMLRRDALEGAPYCRNDGCQVAGHLKDFKVCPQCKSARYCGATRQKEDWNAGGHKDMCGTGVARGKYQLHSESCGACSAFIRNGNTLYPHHEDG